MKLTRIQFWSDSMTPRHVPKDTFKNLKPETVQKMMREAMLADGGHVDLFASKDTFEGSGKNRTCVEERFVMVLDNGNFTEDTHEVDGVEQS